MRLTASKIAILRRLAHGPIRFADLRLLDQRPLRALFLDQALHFDGRFDAYISQAGWDAYRDVFTGKPRTRKHFDRPTILGDVHAEEKVARRAGSRR